MSSIENRKRGVIAVLFVLVVSVVYGGVSIYQIDQRIQTLDKQLEEREENNKAMNQKLDEIKMQQDDLEAIERKKMEAEQRRETSINNLSSRGFDRRTDIGSNIDLSVDDMNIIIDKWSKYMKNGTRFKNHGAAFIQASKETGLNPIYLLAHAAQESAWGNSDIANDRHNYYGINAVDDNPNKASEMGSNIDAGIIAGAHWIKKNFYDKGYRTLESMQRANYATDPNWENRIEQIANDSTQML